MDAVQTLDLRGMDHASRERRLFPAIEGLGEDGALRLVMEFNPVPLIYMLKAKEGYAVAYEKESPGEYILSVKRVATKGEQKGRFKGLLKRLKEEGVTDETRREAKRLLSAIDAKALGEMEQELIREGVSHDEIRSNLCDIHLEAMRDELVAKRMDVGPPHPIHTLMEEHKVILENLRELSALVGRLEGATAHACFAEEIGRLQDVAHHLVEAESHHKREEEALFPALIAHDIVEPPQIMMMDHVELRKKKQELHGLAMGFAASDFAEFKRRAIEAGKFMAKELEGHIFKEDNILYQIALQTLSKDEWDEVKRKCDAIGYCCFTPSDHVEAKAACGHH